MNRTLSTWDVFWRFLSLGCISFGGPAAHLGYFHRYFVERLNWLDTEQYGKLVALSQFLPGPGSSQVGFAIGLQRAGLAGGIAAFIGFTLPSFCVMLGFAGFILSSTNPTWLLALIHGLKLLAVVVVADAILTMSRQFCQSTVSRFIALFSSLILLSLSSSFIQIGLLLLAATYGALFYQPLNQKPELNRLAVLSAREIAAIMLFGSLFVVSIGLIYTNLAPDNKLILLAAQFYQSGSLVFGGGHVVLPLLQQNVEGAISSSQFLSGYAAAQGVPGPMFSLATYLGALLVPTHALTGALVATLALFMPGLLLVYALHAYWATLASRPRIAGAIAAINATVVGILLSAWIDPVLSNAINSLSDIGAAIIGLILLKYVKLPVVVMLVLFVSYGLSILWLS